MILSSEGLQPSSPKVLFPSGFTNAFSSDFTNAFSSDFINVFQSDFTTALQSVYLTFCHQLISPTHVRLTTSLVQAQSPLVHPSPMSLVFLVSLLVSLVSLVPPSPMCLVALVSNFLKGPPMRTPMRYLLFVVIVIPYIMQQHIIGGGRHDSSGF